MEAKKILTILVLALGLILWPGQEASGGTLAAWGSNDYGQCDVPSGSDFVAIAAGGNYSLALKSDGSLAAWGYNGNGQCDVPAGNDFVAIAAGGNHGLALKSDGTLAAWGLNNFGQCDVPAGNDFVAVAAGSYHSLALKSDGSLAAWGRNDDGQCDVPAGNNFVAIAAGRYHNLALKSDGSLAAWGLNNLGQCDVPAGNDFVAIAAGYYHSLALKSDGSLAAWGYNVDGQCNVPAGNDFVAVVAGWHHNIALKSDGSLAAWGRNNYGQCDVPAGNDFVAIAACGDHCLAITMTVQPIGTAFMYQGRLLDEGGPAEGLYDFKFKLFNANVAGMQKGSTIDVNEYDVVDGYVKVELDFGSDVFDGDARWLEIGVRAGELEDPNDYTTLSPRQELTPTPYAIYAETAGGIPGGISGSGTTNYIAKFTGPNTLGDSAIYEEAGNVGIGTTSPTAKLDVDGTVKATAFSGDGSGLMNIPAEGDWTISDSNMYSAVSGYVGIGTTSPDEKLTVNGTIKGTTWDTSGRGVYGEATSAGYVTNYGGYFGAAGAYGRGVYGEATSAGNVTNYGGYFGAAGAYGRGVYGEASNTGDYINYGGYFTAAGDRGHGVYGKASGSDGVGIKGVATGGGSGVMGEAGVGSNADGVYGLARSATDYGVYAENMNADGTGLYAIGGTNGYAAEFRGNVIISSRSTASTVMELGEGLDYAEGFDVSDKSEIAGGTVLVIDSKNPGKLAISDKPYDSKVAGIVAGAKGQGSGVRLGPDEFDFDVALAGRVYCNVDATKAAVEPGDLLTTSVTPGYAMKATDYIRTQGAILGKAMESLEKGKKGQILVLVTLQ